jgi:hypothetical protein
MARLVLGWGTARDVLRVLSAFDRPLLVQLHWGRFPCTFCWGACLSEPANHGLLLRLEILRSPNTYEKQKQADGCGISLQSGRAGFWISWDFGLQPPEAPGPVCGILCDTCLQPPECLGKLFDLHGTLAFSLRAKVPGQASIVLVGNVGVRHSAFPT